MQTERTQLEERLTGLPESKRGTAEEIDILNDLAWEIGLIQTRRARDLSEKALKLSEKISYDLGKAISRRNIGYCRFIASELEPALEVTRSALAIFKKLGDISGEASALDIIALIYWRLGCFDIAFQHAFDGLNLHRQNKFSKGEAWALYNIGLIYFEVGDYTQTIAHYNEAHKIFNKISYPVGNSRVLSGLGEVYQKQGHLEKALHNHLASLEISQEYDIQIGVSSTLSDIGSIYQKMKRFDRAKEYYERSLDLFERLENKEIKAKTLANMGSLYAEMDDSKKAIELLNEALGLAEEAKSLPASFNIHKQLSGIYEKSGRLKEALHHHKRFGQLRDEVFSDESKTKLRNLQIRHKIDKTEKEAEIYRLKNIELASMLKQISEAEDKLVQTEKMAFFGNLIAGLANEVEQPINELAVCSTRISEDLQVIKDAMQSGDFFRDNDRRLLLNSIKIIESDSLNLKSGSDRIEKILRSLTDFAGTEQTPIEVVDLHGLIDNVVEMVLSQRSQKVNVDKVYGDIPPVSGRYHELYQAFMTLVINGFEAIDDRGTILIKTSVDKSSVITKISDTGRGIPPDKLEGIFNIGLTRKESRIGMHIGLASTYNIIQRQEGEISVRSEVNKGTEYTIKLKSAESREHSA